VPQTLVGLTLTPAYKLALGKATHILLRPEYRVDISNKDFFTHQSEFRSRRAQHTLGLGVVYYF
jgi:hypothetical protein